MESFNTLAQRFVARQPILDLEHNIYGYELLFRSGLQNYFDFPDQDEAANRLIANSFLLFGVEELTGGAKAFVNFTHETLTKDFGTVLPPQFTVIEILETVAAAPETRQACERLKKLGFTLALDDFVYRPELEPLLNLADIIKVDVLATTAAQQLEMAQKLLPRGKILLAEKVETQEVFERTKAMGYTLFQGYFFCRPVILTRKDIPTFKMHYLRLLQQVHDPEMDFQNLARTIRNEISISYKLLKYINSAAFALRHKVGSIEQALALLGEKDIKTWVSLLTLTGMAEDKPSELVVCSLIRARACELLAPLMHLEDRRSELFLMGLFSLLDAILDRPLEEVLAEIPMAQDVRTALLGVSGKLREYLDLVVALERGDWKNLMRICTDLKLAEASIPSLYIGAMRWADSLFAEN